MGLLIPHEQTLPSIQNTVTTDCAGSDSRSRPNVDRSFPDITISCLVFVRINTMSAARYCARCCDVHSAAVCGQRINAIKSFTRRITRCCDAQGASAEVFAKNPAHHNHRYQYPSLPVVVMLRCAGAFVYA